MSYLGNVSEETLRKAVSEVSSYAGVFRVLDIPYKSYASLKRYITKYGIDTSHFTGQGWSIGKTKPGVSQPIETYLVKDSNYGSHKLRRRLIKEGFKLPICERCHNTEWLGVHIPLELNHIDGDKHNNLLENLEVLCPNCHAQTPTYRGKNTKKHRGE